MLNRCLGLKRSAVFMASILVLSMIGSGCLKQKFLVKVHPDGSGQMIFSMIYSKQIIAMQEAQKKEMQAHMGNDADDTDKDVNSYYDPLCYAILLASLVTG